MRMRSAVLVSALVCLTLAPGVVFGAGANLGKPISPADLAPWDIDIEPSGAGLPAGSGTSDQGAAIFADNCSACHGDGGRGATTTTSGARYVATIAQRGDPGYKATSVLLGESGLALALDRDKLSDLRGVLTPAAAMGDALLARFPKCGVSLHTARLP